MFAVLAIALVVLAPWASLALHRRLAPNLAPFSVLGPDGAGPGPCVHDRFGTPVRPLTRDLWHGLNHGMILFLCLTVAAQTSGWAFVLARLAQLHVRGQAAPSELVLAPSWAIWVPLALVLALACSLVPLDLLLRWRLGARWPEYCRHERQRTGQDERSGAGLLALVTIFLVGGVVLGTSWFARFQEDRLVVRALGGLWEEAHLYDDVERIVRTTHQRSSTGEEQERKRTIVLFKDGRRWYCEGPCCEGREEQVVRFLSARTGKPLVRARFLEDVTNCEQAYP